MNIFIYRNFISDDEEIMQEKIELLIAENIKDIATVEALSESTWEDVEEVQVNPQDLFRYMRKGYIFLAHCGTEG